MDRIEGKVARILNRRQLVVNRGSKDGIVVGMQLAVLNRKGLDVQDPDTRETMGSVELPKVQVKVVQVQENMCVAQTFRTFRTASGPLSSLNVMAGLTAPGRTETETLRTDEATYKEELSEEDSYVHVGDKIVEITGEEFSGWE
jgi:hypothetical protein